MENREINKGGETIVRLQLVSSIKHGLQLKVWAHPLIEEFFRSRSHVEDVVSNYGAQWIRDKNSPPLTFYQVRSSSELPANSAYTVTMIGEKMFLSERDTGMRAGLVNISFLRLCGISDGVGVSFGLNMVLTESGRVNLLNQLVGAVKQFYSDHLKPFDMVAEVVASKI